MNGNHYIALACKLRSHLEEKLTETAENNWITQ